MKKNFNNTYHHAVLDGPGDVHRADVVISGQVGDRAGNFEDAVIGLEARALTS
jgi:hypothetical protein